MTETVKPIALKAWYAIYTRSRAEKKVRDELIIKDIECYLPLQKKLHQWKDRKKWIEVPLISGYCFVYISRKEYDAVLHTNNAIRYVTFNGKAAIIPDNQIEKLKRMLKQHEFEVSVTKENFRPGKRVKIINGPMIGICGELVEIRGNNKFVLRFEQLQSSFTAEIPISHLKSIEN